MADSGSAEWRHMWGAKVHQPCDMDLEQLKCLVTVARDVLAALPVGSDPTSEHAAEIKAAADARYGKSWQVVVGRHFGVHAIHDAKQFAFFYISDVAVLVTRTQ